MVDSAARKFMEYHNRDLRRTTEKATVAAEVAAPRIEHSIEDVYSRTAQPSIDLYRKTLAIAQANVDAAFDCAREFADVTSPSQFVKVLTKHARQQFEMMNQQSKELTELVQKAAIESMGPFGSLVGGTLLGRPDRS
jgi:hypothetical protein